MLIFVGVDLDLHPLSVYNNPPHRSCSRPNAQATTCTSKDACASAITSINDATLPSMNTGFTVSHHRQRALGAPCTCSLSVNESLWQGGWGGLLTRERTANNTRECYTYGGEVSY